MSVTLNHFSSFFISVICFFLHWFIASPDIALSIVIDIEWKSDNTGSDREKKNRKQILKIKQRILRGIISQEAIKNYFIGIPFRRD